ncbi:non-ribosomal peptide synthetase [Burkholderia pseudomallei]|uniref:non-ribosomal peptide synthetase n=1 Tax=Burkholderia pseudomallei TaxID=28450 RepID=UPI0012490995|nr:non-ribosomal peptide synthetase [Burkholderia pseudomallei]QEW42744.1 amino acid adenylation domain-containing protein [Burkholderia pseudomallei]QEW56231.1 amino acid adenylation domain-containing protein [Burkholderia pseudomallei]QEW65708.1 amino acid adenylation domain-containing protein [Burkholderia pseudomallei]QEW71962.1 amino acid adenylation domain-containing protein [Burkholderia pseudomallei]QEW76674.1 amino acid adenylation domain-containing protein [Burkholderia pseudomallei]
MTDMLDSSEISVRDDIDPVPGAAPERVLALTAGQYGIWLDQMLNPDLPCYILGAILRIDGTFDEALLTSVVNEVVNANDSLRAVLVSEGGSVRQRVLSDVELEIAHIDFSGSAHPHDSAWRYMRTAFDTAFALDGLLCDFRIVRESPSRTYWMYRCHHLVADGQSVSMICRMIVDLYNRRASADMARIEPTPSYFDSLDDDRKYAESSRYERDAQFWQDKFSSLPPPLLSSRSSEAAARPASFPDGQVNLTIERAKYDRLGRIAEASGCTIVHVMFGVLALYFSRAYQVDEVVIGMPVHNRSTAQQKRAIGMFASVVPIRIPVDGNERFVSLLNGVSAELRHCYRHQRFPIAELNRRLGLVRTGRRQLFDLTLSFEKFPLDFYIGDVKLGLTSMRHRFEQTPITVNVQDYHEDQDLVMQFNYDVNAFSHAEVDNIGTRIGGLLDALIEHHDDMPVGMLPLLDEAERKQVVYAWNATERDYPIEQCIHQLFEAQVDRKPEAIALTFDGQRLGYAELNARANRLAHYLQARGVGPDRLVALCAERGIEMVVGLLAILKAGGAYVPLDPSHPPERLRRMLDDTNPVAVLVDDIGADALASFESHVAARSPRVHLSRDIAQWRACSPANPSTPRERAARRLAYVIYTSGSSGEPKGVMNEHRGVVNRLWWMQQTYALDERDAVLQKTPFSFDVSVWEFFWPLMSGARLVIAKPEGHKDPAYLSELIDRERVTTLHFVPSMLQAFLEDEGAARGCGSVKRVMCSGEALPPSLVKRFYRCLPDARLHNLYGPTEAAVDVTAWACDAEEGGASVPIGRPIANTRIYVLDGYGQPVPRGVAGELYIGGVQVARGYLNRPELTRERFVDDPFVAGGRLYKTGDLARWRTDGSLEYLGRNDFQVKIRGFRIELGEIEAQLAKVAGVRETVVLARDSGSPAGEKRLVAYYTGNADVAALREQATRHLPAYMVPSAYVRLDAWPLTPNGKLDRRALPAPADDAYARAEYEAPQGAKEEALAAIWKDLLPVERISRHDNFFELGGHSLLVIGLSEKLRAAGLHADVRVVYRASTLADLAAHLGTDNQDIRIPPNLIADGDEHITPAQLTLVALSQESIDALVTKVEGGAANVQDIYPLAPLQEGILFHHLMSGESDPYVLSGVLAFRGREVMERFVSALQQVIDRHDILRTGFFWEGLEQPVQVVQRRATLPVSVVELDAGEGDIVRQLEARFDSRGYRMDVSRAPLMHVHAACDGEHERWVARVLFHHLSIDHTTLERVIEEARAIGQGRVEDLPRPAPFRNFVAQARLGVSEADHEAYFRAKLGDIDEPTAPFGLLSVQGDGREIAEAARRLKPELSGALRGHARRLGVSAASMMHVAWGLVLSRTTGRQDVVFGTVLFGRMQGGAQSDRALGLFINTLPVRMRVAQTGVEASVKGTHAQLAELMRHEHAPLVLAQRCSGVPAQTPLFTSLLNYRYSKPKVAAAHIADGIELLDGHERTSYPLSMTVDDHERDFTIVAKVCERIGPQRVCELMELALEQLTRALSANPGGELAELDVLPAAERTQVLHGWNETGRAYARDACLHQLFEAQVSRTPEAAAVICGDETLSYTDLDARANRLAHYLRGQGVGPDTRVGLALGRGVEMMTGLLAVLKAGGAYVPLDPGYASERLRAILDDSRPAIVLADAAGRTALDALAGTPPIADLQADASRWSALPSTPPRVEGLTPRHLAYVIYTSGSTGQPKGVMVEHASVVNLWRALDEAIYRTHPSARRVSLNASIAFDSLVKQWVQLLSGRTLVVVPEPVRFDGRRLLDAIGRDRIDVFDCTPSQLALIEGARGPEDEAYPQVTLVGGEAIGEGMWSELASASSRTYYNVYGPTECTVDATLARITAEHAPHIGGPLANVRAYVLNERLSPAPVGVRGELYIGGAGVARGYLNRPELTRERFIDDPFVAGGRLYRTGDLARWRTDGRLEYLGRNDFQVKIRGFRIELGEIEAQLAKVAGVREVVVLARDSASEVHDSATEHAAPDAPSPETATATEKRLVAYYTGDADVAALRAQAAQHLPSYMVPSAYVRLDAWPLTPNGKLDRRALPAPADDAYARAEYEAPRGAKEEALAAIWRELLHVERVSRHDNFFELGGHSLLAVQLVSRLRQALSVEVALSTVFDAPVLSALAERLEAENTAVLPPIPLAPRDGRIALSLAQQRLWFLTQLEGVSEAYHMSGAVRLDGPLNREVLQRALNRIVMRHEALRTCFAREEGEPIQVIQPHADLTVSYHDLREAEQTEQRAKDLSQAHASAPFDLSRDLPVRVLLLQLADEAHVVQVVMHHIASDGWSVGVFLQELSALYGSFIAEQGDPLAPLPLQYADYAAWQRRWLASGQLEKQGAFWQTNLSGAPTLLELPTDRPRPPKQSHAGASVEVKLGAALSERVKRLSQRHGVTPYMTLLSSWAAVLSRLSGQEEVVIGSPVAGRNRTEVEALIGFFVNTLALRLDLSSEPTVGELLKRTKAQVLSAQAHQDLPFDQVVERVKPPRSTAHPPLFQVMFVWQNMPAGELTIPGLTIRAVETPLQTAQFELTLSLREAGDDIVGHLNYASALFDESTVRRYVTYWRRLLEGMTAGAADQTIVGLPLLDEAERKQVVYAWNATERDYPIEQCIHQLFEAQVDRKPEAIALTFDGRRLSYAELNARANRLAHYLQGRGVGPDRLVALCAERGIEMVVGLLAILKAGGAYVPLDPSHPPERLRRMLDDTNPVAVLVDDIGADALASFESHVAARSPRVHLSRDIAQWRACSPANPSTPRERAARRLAYVIYTSGSSGEPKGVMNEHRGVVNRLWWMQQTYALDERDAVLQKTPFSFDVSVWEFFWPLMSGARLVIAKPEGHKDPAYLSELIDRERVTTLHFVPSMLQAFLEDEGAARGCGSVKRVMCSGEALPPSLVKRFYRCLPDARLHNLYGPTEAAVDVTAWACDAEEGGASVPIGRPIANTRIYVLDEYGQPVPRGVAGELYIGGVQVARGYLNRPELTRERFVDDPFVAGGRLYKTGDLARWRTDGSLEYLGRNDFQVKIRGFRIELGEIEAQLAKVAGVRETVVLAREAAPDTKRHAASNENSASNSGEKRLVAYYTGDADATALRAQAAQHLPSYMVPSAYVRLDAWPLTPNGKLDRHALPAPADDAYARAEYEAPQGAKEEALAAIWKDLLPVERISRHDNFFELGGHSLLAITLIEHMRRANLHADVTTLFTAPTLADLAVRVGASRGDTYVPPNLIPGDAANGTPESAEVEELRL